jgi:hypothetical protein
MKSSNWAPSTTLCRIDLLHAKDTCFRSLGEDDTGAPTFAPSLAVLFLLRFFLIESFVSSWKALELSGDNL